MICKQKDDLNYSYSENNKNLNISNLHHFDNLPLKCIKDVNKIYNNIGFWLFLILSIFIIITSILYLF